MLGRDASAPGKLAYRVLQDTHAVVVMGARLESMDTRQAVAVRLKADATPFRKPLYYRRTRDRPKKGRGRPKHT